MGASFALSRVLPVSSIVAWFTLVTLCVMSGRVPADVPLTVGVGTHFGQDRYDLSKSRPLLEDLGIHWIRDEIYWSQVEKLTGRYSVPGYAARYMEQMTKDGTSVLLVLGYGNRFHGDGRKPRAPADIAAFTDYSTYLARTYRSRVQLFEVWNEWQGRLGGDTPGTPSEYLALLRASAAGIRAVHPEAKILGGATTPESIRAGWLDEFVKIGGLDSLDALSIHPYFHSERNASPEGWYDWLSSVVMRAEALAGRRIEVYLTEMGWPAVSGRARFSESVRAENAARIVLLSALMPSIKGLWWYELKDGGWDDSEREQTFGLTRASYAPKDSYYSMGAAVRLVSESKSVKRSLEIRDPDLWVLEFSNEGDTCAAVWSTSATKAVRFRGRSVIDWSTQRATAPAKLRLFGASGPASEQTVQIGAVPTYICGYALRSLTLVDH